MLRAVYMPACSLSAWDWGEWNLTSKLARPVFAWAKIRTFSYIPETWKRKEIEGEKERERGLWGMEVDRTTEESVMGKRTGSRKKIG